MGEQRLDDEGRTFARLLEHPSLPVLVSGVVEEAFVLLERLKGLLQEVFFAVVGPVGRNKGKDLEVRNEAMLT